MALTLTTRPRLDVHMSLYTADLLARLEPAAADGPVAALCRREAGTDAPATAALIDEWVERYNPPANVRKHLTGANADNFWTAYGELQVAAALDLLGFTVDMRHKIEKPSRQPLTPDILARKDGHPDLVVEVVSKANDQRTRNEQSLLQGIAADLQQRLELPELGFLSLTALTFGGEVECPDDAVLDQVAAKINEWLRRADYGERFTFDRGPFPLMGNLMKGDRPQVVLTPLGGALNQAWRIGTSLQQKIDKYGDSITSGTRLTVAVVARGWKITEHQLLSAMMGGEVMVLDGQTGEPVEVRHSGRGAAVAGGDFDAGNAATLSGAWYLESRGFLQHDPPARPMHLAFVHSPYATAPVTPEHIGAGRQYVVDGSVMRWVGEAADGTVVLR